MAPDFLCIGAQKAGTTWLHENLSLQPEIFLPPVKELHFLDHPAPSLWKRLAGGVSHHRLARQNFFGTMARWLRGRSSSEELRLAWRIAFSGRDWKWYQRVFESAGDRTCGEICPGYARMTPADVAKLAKANPKLKIIYLLRDPVDRAWSSVAMHFRKSGAELITAREDEQIIARLKFPKTLAHCEYRRNIETWLAHFPAEQVYFGFFERIGEEPEACLRDILKFLGIAAPVMSGAAGRPVNQGKGEVMPPTIEREIAAMLLAEAQYLDRRFANRYTGGWLRHAEMATGVAVGVNLPG